MDNYTGKRLDGRYEIQEVIGVGGMAVVYKAYDNIDDRIVAVKILKDEFLANEEFRRRFKNESKAISLLSHPNIVKVYNVNYGDRLQYIVMEYIEGITLKEYIEQQGRLGIKETIHFTMQILRALQHAHDKGIIHRDIKPQNILLLSNGNIKVTDFGIARFSYSDTKTMTDSAIGSVHYISPEQARGNSIDERTDIYSVGVVMYEMLTGTLPFVSDNSVSVALMQLQNDARSVREINPNIPVGLEQIVKRAMEKNTKSRYQTASEMLLDIEEFKRNPNIVFRQEYFVDSDPTRFATNGPAAPVVPPHKAPVQQPTPVNEPDEDDDDNYSSRGKGGFIAVGIIAGLLVLVLATVVVLWITKPTINVFGHEIHPFSSAERVEVPDFSNLNYYTDVKGNQEYDGFTIEVKEVSDASYDNGTIIKQSPEAKRRIDPTSEKITLTVVKNSEDIVVPDVSGETYENAQKALVKLGFSESKVLIQPYPSTTVSYGTVVKTSPAAGESVKTDEIADTTIIVYYASDDGFIDCPDVVNLDVDTATEKLASLGLTINTDIEYKESDTVANGLIISQDPAANSKIAAGGSVKIVVSKGSAQKTATITISLPNSGQQQSYTVYVNNEPVKNGTLLMDGNKHSFEATGTAANSSVKIYINGDEYYTCTVDFTSSNPTARGGQYAGISEGYAILPDVEGLSVASATSKLKDAGFTNITTQSQLVSDPSKDGVVLSQSPSGTNSFSLNTNYWKSTSTQIILTVGSTEGVGDSTTSTTTSGD